MLKRERGVAMGIRLIKWRDLVFGAVFAGLLWLAWSVWTAWTAYELSLSIEERVPVSGTIYMPEEACGLLEASPAEMWISGGDPWPGIGEFNPSAGGAKYETSVAAEGLWAHSGPEGWRTGSTRAPERNAIAIDVPPGWKVTPSEHLIEKPALSADFRVERTDG